MDTRFPPLASYVRVPLYPNKTRFGLTLAKYAEEDFLHHLSNSLKYPTEQLLVASSASAALYAWLSEICSYKAVKVAIPAYSCQSIVEAIICAGGTPVFIDINDDLSIPMHSIEYSIKQKCDIFIWPSYFGARKRKLNLINLLRKQKIIIIFDEAQSFPVLKKNENYEHFKQADYILLSFGHSKSLASSGGGAIMSTKYCKTIETVKKNVALMPIPRLDNASLFKEVMINKTQLYSPKIAIKFGLLPRPHTNLDQLIIHKPYILDKRIRISPREAITGLRQLRTYPNKIFEHQKNYEQIKDMIQIKLGIDSLKLLKNIIGVPTILGLSVNGKDRYKLFDYFSQHGIQTTWYYYPLNMIPRYKKYESETTLKTNKLASSIIILPFQWVHTKKQQKILLNIINNIK